MPTDPLRANPGEPRASAARSERLLGAGLALERLLRRILYTFVRNPTIVDDLLQKVYVRLCEVDQADPPLEIHSPRALVLTIARNIARDHLDHVRIDPVDRASDDVQELDHHDSLPDVADIVNGEQHVAILERIANQLPGRCRQVFTLRKVYGYTQWEISTRLGISIAKVEAQLTKAVRHFASRYFIETSSGADGAVDPIPLTKFGKPRKLR